MRYALYFTPPDGDPLTRAAARWLGRDAFADRLVAHPEINAFSADDIAALTADARRYGFHGTLKAPFHLHPDMREAELAAALDAFAAARPSETGPRLEVGEIEGFIALIPAEESAALQDLADDVVRKFDQFRAPLTETDYARRDPSRLPATARANLDRWGYPYVFDTFRFHMTLTKRQEPSAIPRVRTVLQRHLGPLLDEPIELSAVALFVEPHPGAPFTVRSIHRFSASNSREYA